MSLKRRLIRQLHSLGEPEKKWALEEASKMLVIIIESTFVAKHHSKYFSYMNSLSPYNYAKCLLLPP